MGGSQSREGLELSDSSDYEDGHGDDKEEEYEDKCEEAGGKGRTPTKPMLQIGTKTLDEVDSKLKSLKLKYPASTPSAVAKNAVKLYLHVGGNTPKAKWVVSEKLTFYKFIKTSKIGNGNSEDDLEEESEGEGFWVLKVGKKVRVRISTDMQLKFFGEQRRVDFVDKWGLGFEILV